MNLKTTGVCRGEGVSHVSCVLFKNFFTKKDSLGATVLPLLKNSCARQCFQRYVSKT